jgi:aspartyl-tRNA(Asn)/glutamyl-tRNA(Gln) amidotransferase subunit C
MAIDRAEVQRIAALARLEIGEDEVERTARELSAVLEFVSALRRLDLGGSEPSSLAPVENALREDRTNGRRLSTEMALAAAPEAEDGFFLVPPIVENLAP